MRRVTIVLTLSAFIMCLSCDEKLVLVKCADCTEEEPVEASLEVKLDVYQSLTSGIINIYEGDIEDNILLGTFFSSDDIWRHNVPLNKKYTLTATYRIGEITYIVVDSATPRVRYETKQCDNPCYFVYDNTLNLRIKSTLVKY
jgi:hypothetical protein